MWICRRVSFAAGFFASPPEHGLGHQSINCPLRACLQVLERSGTDREKKHAARVAPVSNHFALLLHCCSLPLCAGQACPSYLLRLLQVLKRPHLLLVTLLLVNAAAMEVRFASKPAPLAWTAALNWQPVILAAVT